MDLPALISTKERERILDYLLKHPSVSINMRRIARELNLSPGQIHKYVTIMRNEGLVEADALVECPLTSALRLLLNTKRISDADIVGLLRKRFIKMKGVGIYGSWASGTNGEKSDLDVWIKIGREPRDIEMARARRDIEKRIGVEADLVFATPQRLKNLREKSDAFYYSLYNGKILWGEAL